jgi:hypothetical protein
MRKRAFRESVRLLSQFVKKKAPFVDGGYLTGQLPLFSDRLFECLTMNAGPTFKRIAVA